MTITELHMQNALLEIFARKRLAQGDILEISQLERFWDSTGLRRSDLVMGIAQLCTRGMLDLREDGDPVGLSLTAAGEVTANEILHSGVDYGGRYLRKELLPFVRLLSKAPGEGGRGRRSYERGAFSSLAAAAAR